MWKGRPPSISHYEVFCAILYILPAHRHALARFTIMLRQVAPNADHGFHRLFKYLMFA